MATIFPCAQGNECLDPSNPFENLSSETDDGPTFIGIDYGFGRPKPKLGSSWRVAACKTVCTSQISAADALLCAARDNYECLTNSSGTPPGFPLPDPDGDPTTNPTTPPSDPPVTPDAIVYNARISVSIVCPDGLPFTIIVQSGQFSASSQALANQMAVSYAQQQLLLSRFCLGAINPVACVDAAYSSAVTVTGAGQNPFTFTVVSGELPLGVTLTTTGPRTALLSGTPMFLGDSSFTIRATDATGNFMDRIYRIHVVQCHGTFTNELQTVACPPPFTDVNHTYIPIDPNGLYVEDGVVNAAPGFYFSDLSQADANAQALTAAQVYFSDLIVDGTIVCAPICEGDPIAALKDFSIADNSFMAAIVPDINTANAVVTYGNFGWAKYRTEYAGFGAFEIDVVPPGPGPEDEWLTNANPGGGFTTLFEMQYMFGLAVSQTNLPVTAPSFTQAGAEALMAGKFSSTVEHLPLNAGSPTTPSTTKAIGIKTKTAPYLILTNNNPTWNLVRLRKLSVTLPEGLAIDDFATILPAMVGVDAAVTDTTSAIWDGTLPGFNTGGLGPPMTFFEYRALYNGSPNKRLFNKRIGIFCTARHFESTFATSTGCAFVLAIDFTGGGLAWAGFKKTGSTTSPVGDYCFDAALPGYTLADERTEVRLATESALPPWNSGCVLLTLTAQQVTIADAAWADPIAGYRIFKYAFTSPTDFSAWWITMTALDAGAVNVYILASDGTTIVDFEYNMDANSQRQFAIPAAGNYYLGVAAFEADGLPRTFSLETSCEPEAPVISSLANPTLFDGDTLFIFGKYFGLVQGASTVTINGTNATVVLWGESIIQVTVPVTTYGPGTVVVTVNGLASNAFCCAVANSALKALTWKIDAYDETLFSTAGCAPFASGNPAWAGTYVYFDQYSSDSYWVSHNWNTTYPSNFSINGALLAQSNIQYESCPTADAPAIFTLWIWLSDDAIGSSRTLLWKGSNSTLTTPAGTYTRVAGCAPGPASLTVSQI